MNTHLKGRIFKAAGTSYLVLHDDAGSPEWVRVKALDSKRAVHWIRCDDLATDLAPGVNKLAPA